MGDVERNEMNRVKQQVVILSTSLLLLLPLIPIRGSLDWTPQFVSKTDTQPSNMICHFLSRQSACHRECPPRVSITE